MWKTKSKTDLATEAYSRPTTTEDEEAEEISVHRDNLSTFKEVKSSGTEAERTVSEMPRYGENGRAKHHDQ